MCYQPRHATAGDFTVLIKMLSGHQGLLHLGSKKQVELLILISKTSFILQNFRIGLCAGPQKQSYKSRPGSVVFWAKNKTI